MKYRLVFCIWAIFFLGSVVFVWHSYAEQRQKKSSVVLQDKMLPQGAAGFSGVVSNEEPLCLR